MNAVRSRQKQTKGLPTRNVHLTVLREAMSMDTCHPAGVYFGTETGQLFRSGKEGREWLVVADYWPPTYSVEDSILETS